MNYIWHHIHSLWYHTMLWHHTHCIHVITPRIPVSASTVAGPLLIVYSLYHTYYMCDMKPTICMTSQEFYMTPHSLFMTQQYCIHNITSPLFMTAHLLYITSHTLYLRHHSHSIYDKTTPIFMTLYSVYMTSHMVYEWQSNQGIKPHTHSICVITPTWLIISHPMHMWKHTVNPAQAPDYISVLCHPEILGSCCLFLLTRAVFFWPTKVSTGIHSPMHTHTDT